MIKKRHPGAMAALALLVVLPAVVAGCSTAAWQDYYPQSSLAPESDFAWMIQWLFDLIFWLAVVVFVAVEGMLLYAVIRFREKPGQSIPAQLHGNTRLEIAWTIAPAIILAIIAVPTVSTIFATAAPARADALKVRVVAHQWWWEFHYPDLGVVTANEFHVPVGRQISVKLESADTIHSFWIPRMGGKRDMVPNQINELWFTPERTGVYLGQCAEFCGESHANMRMRLIVQNQAEFDAWVAAQKRPAAAASGEAQQGAQIFAQKCAVCHTIAGTNAQGKIGPDLTHFGSRTSVAAGMMDNTPANLASWLRDPLEIKPGSKMPDLNLSESDIAALVAYLQSLK